MPGKRLNLKQAKQEKNNKIIIRESNRRTF